MKNVNEMSGPELVAKYNELTGKNVKKFSTKAIGVKAVNKALDNAIVGDKPAPKAKAKAKSKAKAKVGGKKAARVVGDSRTDEAVVLMRKGEQTVSALMTEFKTSYKNITGTLFVIRKGKGLKEGEKLECRREGMVRYYSVVKAK